MVVPAGVMVHVALGYTDMRKGMDDQGEFVWPRLVDLGGTVTLSPAQLAMLIEGIDWRSPERVGDRLRWVEAGPKIAKGL
jgi:transposase